MKWGRKLYIMKLFVIQNEPKSTENRDILHQPVGILENMPFQHRTSMKKCHSNSNIEKKKSFKLEYWKICQSNAVLGENIRWIWKISHFIKCIGSRSIEFAEVSINSFISHHKPIAPRSLIVSYHQTLSIPQFHHRENGFTKKTTKISFTRRMNKNNFFRKNENYEKTAFFKKKNDKK